MDTSQTAREGSEIFIRKDKVRDPKPQRARELHDKGMTLPEIAQALRVDKRTVSRYLKRGSA